MIDKKFCATQIERLAGLDWFPRNELAALNELSLAAQAAASEPILMHVINEWLRSERECPKPADLRTLIWTENEKRENKQALTSPNEYPLSVHCPVCRGFGVRETIPDASIKSTASWCECETGRRRRQQEPDWVNRVNNARKRILPLTDKAGNMEAMALSRMPMHQVTDTYNGEF